MSLKNRARVGTTLAKETAIKMDILTKETRIPKSKLFDEAIRDLYDKYRKRNMVESYDNYEIDEEENKLIIN